MLMNIKYSIVLHSCPNAVSLNIHHIRLATHLVQAILDHCEECSML